MFDISPNADASPKIVASSHNNGVKGTLMEPMGELLCDNLRYQEPLSSSSSPNISYRRCAKPESYVDFWTGMSKVTSSTVAHQYPTPRRVSCSSTENSNNSLGLIRPFDVICGRSRLAHSHVGNKDLRQLIKNYSQEYQCTSCRQEKKRITTMIIGLVHSRGGRFLAVNNCDEAVSVTHFDIVSAEYQYMKVSHALRNHKVPSPSIKKMQRSADKVASSTTPMVPPTIISFGMIDEDGTVSVISCQGVEDLRCGSDDEDDPLLARPTKEVEPIWHVNELDVGEIDLELLFRL